MHYKGVCKMHDPVTQVTRHLAANSSCKECNIFAGFDAVLLAVNVICQAFEFPSLDMTVKVKKFTVAIK